MINCGRRAPGAVVGGLDVGGLDLAVAVAGRWARGRGAPPSSVQGACLGLGCPHPPRRAVRSPLVVPVIFFTTAPPQLL